MSIAMVKNQSFSPTQSSFRYQLLLFTALGSVIFSLVTSLLIALLVSGMAKEYMTSNGIQVATGLSEQSTLAVLTESSENAEAAVEKVRQFPEITGAKIVLASGVVLIQQGDFELSTDLSQLSKVEESQLLFENDTYWLFAAPILIIESDQGEEDEFALESEDGENAEVQLMGYSIVKMSKDTLSTANRLIVTYALIVGGVAVLIFTIVANYGLSKLTQPLLNLAQVMLDAEKTGEHLRAGIDGPREVQKMAHAYNGMMEVLDAQDEELRLHRDQLEAEVDIRTRELIEARDTALTANRHKSEFLANMTHELRTPIQAIVGYVDLVQEELELEGLVELQEDLDKVTNNSKRLLSLINSVLDFAKVEAGKMDVNPEKISTSIIVGNVKETVLPLVLKNHNELKLVGADLNLDMFVDREKLEQVLVNLLTNACKFTNEGVLTFETVLEDKSVRFSVVDNGIGIEESHVKSIFEEFQQVDGSQSRQFQGTGLGLAICKRFCELLGAEIGVVSTLGEGSTFFVKVPLEQPVIVSSVHVEA
jgi:two-component system sensor histidine kinase BarA